MKEIDLIYNVRKWFTIEDFLKNEKARIAETFPGHNTVVVLINDYVKIENAYYEGYELYRKKREGE